MNDSYQIYEQQVKKAKETIQVLENELREVRMKLKYNRKNTGLLQKLRKTSIEMDTTVYELEHCQSILEKRNCAVLKTS